MSSDQKNAPAKKEAPSKKKKLLIALLILSIVAGSAGGVYFLYRSSSVFGFSMKKSLEEFPIKNLSDLSTLLQNKIATREPDIVLSFQGTLLGEQGAIAVINDQMVAAGAEFEGVRIVEINNRKLVINYRGETQTLSIGETVSISQD